MKVLSVKPNNLSDHIQPSLGLGFLAEGIRARHEVIILDCIKEDIGPTQFVQRVLKDCRPDLVGIQCYTFDLGNVCKLLKAIKEWNPDIITVVGGAHISSDPTRAFVNLEANLDFAFAGEAEEGFPKFIDMLGDPATERDYFSIPGLIWKNDQELVANPVYMEEDLDRLGYPAWDLIRPDLYPEAQHGAFFILGFPEETLETIQDTIDLSMELPLLRANYFTYLPLPGTESYHRLEETGEIDNVDWDNFYMMDAAYTPPGIKREELLVIRKKAFLKFYLRPRVLIRNLLSIKNFRHFKLLFKRFYSWIIVKNHHSTDFVVHHEPSSQAPVSLATLK